MPVYQLVREVIQNFIDGEVAFFLRHLCIEENLEQEIAQFTGQLFPVPVIDSF